MKKSKVKIRVAQEPHEVYWVTCSHCGQEDMAARFGDKPKKTPKGRKPGKEKTHG